MKLPIYSLIAFCVLNAFLSRDSMANQQKQTMPISSLWAKLAQGETRLPKDIQSLFLEDVRNFEYENQYIPEKQHGMFRVMCFNVRMWTTVHEESNFDTASSLIQKLDPDILILQEVVDWQRTYNHYVACGYNAIAAHCKTKNPPFSPVIFAKNCTIVKAEDVVFKAQMNPSRELCYVRLDVIKNGLPITVYNTHLEVDQKQLCLSTEDVRKKELEEILADIKQLDHQNIIIAGDFNSVQEKDYAYTVDGQPVWDLLKQAYASNNVPLVPQVLDVMACQGYRTSFEQIGWAGPKFTNWASRVLDFVYLSSGWRLKQLGSYIYYTDMSDHLPIIVDFTLD